MLFFLFLLFFFFNFHFLLHYSMFSLPFFNLTLLLCFIGDVRYQAIGLIVCFSHLSRHLIFRLLRFLLLLYRLILLIRSSPTNACSSDRHKWLNDSFFSKLEISWISGAFIHQAPIPQTLWFVPVKRLIWNYIILIQC